MITENIYIWVDNQTQKNKVIKILEQLGNRLSIYGGDSGTIAIYSNGECMFFDCRKGLFDSEVSFQEFLDKYGGEKEFKVGDMVRQIKGDIEKIGWECNRDNTNTPEMVKSGVKKVMEGLVQFAKNIVLSADEKVLRETGVKDSQGNYTSEARQIVVNLEAVELGYKSEQDLFERVGYSNNLSSFEYATLLKKYEAKLLEIAKAKREEDKK